MWKAQEITRPLPSPELQFWCPEVFLGGGGIPGTPPVCCPLLVLGHFTPPMVRGNSGWSSSGASFLWIREARAGVPLGALQSSPGRTLANGVQLWIYVHCISHKSSAQGIFLLCPPPPPVWHSCALQKSKGALLFPIFKKKQRSKCHIIHKRKQIKDTEIGQSPCLISLSHFSLAAFLPSNISSNRCQCAFL